MLLIINIYYYYSVMYKLTYYSLNNKVHTPCKLESLKYHSTCIQLFSFSILVMFMVSIISLQSSLPLEQLWSDFPEYLQPFIVLEDIWDGDVCTNSVSAVCKLSGDHSFRYLQSLSLDFMEGLGESTLYSQEFLRSYFCG